MDEHSRNRLDLRVENSREALSASSAGGVGFPGGAAGSSADAVGFPGGTAGSSADTAGSSADAFTTDSDWSLVAEAGDDWDVDPRSLSSRWSLGRLAVTAVILIVCAAVVLAWWSSRPVDVAETNDVLTGVTASIGSADAGTTSVEATGSPAALGAASEGADAALSDATGMGASARFGEDLPGVASGFIGEGSGKQEGSVAAHVVGQVRSPGLVVLPAGARWADAIEAAGGMRKNAAQRAINLARTVQDGEQIHVPKRGSAAASQSAAGVSNSHTGTDEGALGSREGDSQSAPGDTSRGTSTTGDTRGQGESAGADGGVTGRINLNTASEVELQQLPGIGPALAGQIMAWRSSIGQCTNTNQLLDVSGIGTARLAAIADLVTC